MRIAAWAADTYPCGGSAMSVKRPRLRPRGCGRMAAAAAAEFLLLCFPPLLLLLRGCGAEDWGRPNVFRAAGELLPGGAGETLLRYWKLALNGTTAIASLFTASCSDLLDVLGIEGGELGTDREALVRVLAWVLAALLIYLALSAALRLLGYLVGRLLWLVKLGLFLTAAAYVVITCEEEKRRNSLLLGLGLLYLLLSRVYLPAPGGCRGAEQRQHQLEKKISSLEQQLAEMEDRLQHRNLYD